MPYECKKSACAAMQIFAKKKRKEKRKMKKFGQKDPGRSFMPISYRENMKKKSEILLSIYEVENDFAV